MTRGDRRSLLRVAAAAVALSAIPLHAQSARFAPPATPMLYSRRLERGLPGGARLVVGREFAVRFVPEGTGFRVDGEQVGVAVEAPEQLAELARLERERKETGLFPLTLDAGGGIRGGSALLDTAKLDEAVRAVVTRIDAGEHTPAERAALREFVDAVHRSAGALLTELPHDLFAPERSPREETRAIALPGGDQGKVRVSFTAERDPATGLMRAARREVVTDVAGDLRRSVESWTLRPLAEI